jgi:hypothetical protein
MHCVGLAAAVGMTALMALHGSPVLNPDTAVACNPKTNACRTKVTASGHPAGISPATRINHSRGLNRKSVSTKSGACRTTTEVPQPPKSDPIWNGHRTGKILVYPCWLLQQMDGHRFWAPAAPDAQGAATVSPAQLAREALAQLRIPEPVIRRSPDESAVDTGGPVTWVNMWTWVWTQKETWRQLSKTASLGTVWATVTVKPTQMVFHPGGGLAPVPCPGPGRAWTPADGDGRPAQGGCGYVYRAVRTSVTASLVIHWAVSWTGSGGSSGQLPAMTTRASDRFAIEQIQVVNR